MPRRHTVGRGISILSAFLLVFVLTALLLSYLGGGQQGAGLWSDAVGVIEVRGVINGADKIIDSIRRFAKADHIRAVVLRVESPGGGVTPSQEIYRELTRLKEKKPVIASLGGVAASGGYYIASACSMIIANPGTITGSIGVIMETVNVQGLLEKLGVKGVVIKAGTYKDLGSPLREMSTEEQQILGTMLDDVHQQFISAVATGRHMDEAKVQTLADGRVYSGEQALHLGLVDQLGSFQDAIAVAAEKAGITGEPQVIRAEKQKRVWWQRLLSVWLGEELWGDGFGVRLLYLGPQLS
ncbi:MAG TPA: signal peptide peptidase SppA [Candidatus Binatia bacterium]|nr:signal peptide peptidase SppA [Candidatus Binatia bacterium]